MIIKAMLFLLLIIAVWISIDNFKIKRKITRLISKIEQLSKIANVECDLPIDELSDEIKINCLGIDLNLRIDDLAYGYIQDVNEFYSVGDVIPVKILEIDKENNKLKVSAKELLKDPYKNIRIYFTEGGEYVGTITGYAPNGVYIKLMQGVDAAAIIPIWMNKSPNIGDYVAVRIYEIDVRKRKIYCSLLRVIKEKK